MTIATVTNWLLDNGYGVREHVCVSTINSSTVTVEKAEDNNWHIIEVK